MKWMIPVVFFLVTASTVSAEGPLTLEDCLAEASENSPDLAAAKAAVQKAKYDYKASYGPLLPQLSADASSGRRRISGSSGGTGSSSSSINDSASYGVSASQSLFTGGKNLSAVDQGAANLQSAQADLDSARASLTFNVWRAFADLMFAQEQIDLSETILKRRQDDLELLKLRYAGGMENKGALLLTQASAQDAEYSLAAARRNLKVAQREMARALGRSDSDRIQAAGKLVADPPEEKMDFEALAAATPTHRKTVAQLRSARAGLDAARSQYYPDISANASASKDGDHWMPDQEQWFVGVSLSFPFFTGGSSIMNVRSAKAQILLAEATLRLTDEQLVFDLERAVANYANAVEQTIVQSGYLNAEDVRAEIGRSQYSEGMLSFEDWDRIENDLIGSQKTDLSSRRDAVIAQANWEQVQGKNRLPEQSGR